MNLAEIEAAIPELTTEEVDLLTRKLEALQAARRAPGHIFTGYDALRWWKETKHLSPADAEEFARDVEEGRAEMNRPPVVPSWE